MNPCTFSFPDGGTFDGFTAGDTWNGFDVVYVTQITLNDIIAYFSDPDYSDVCADLAGLPSDDDGLVSLSGYCTEIEA